MIKTPSHTIVDRSVVINLVRKLQGQRVEALGIDAIEKLKDTRRRILRWSMDCKSSIVFDIESIPLIGNDRARQNWAVLAAYSKVLGSPAHAALLQAATELSDTSDKEENLETDMLNDIRELLKSFRGEHIQSAVLVNKLTKMKERQWLNMDHGKSITEHRLSRMLKPFKLIPIKFRDGAATYRGYSVAALHSVFDRYLSSEMTA
jgi:hypothetical protein